MTIHEYGTENEKKVLFIATAGLEPYWAFQKQADALGTNYHVYAVAADGHDGQPGDFISIEKTVSEMSAELKRRGVTRLYAAYGLSMGGAIVVRFLATGDDAYLLSPILFDLTGFPPMDIFYGTDEVMIAYLPDMQAVCKKYGVQLNTHIGDGMMHCWGAMEFVPEAKAVRKEYFKALT